MVLIIGRGQTFDGADNLVGDKLLMVLIIGRG